MFASKLRNCAGIALALALSSGPPQAAAEPPDTGPVCRLETSAFMLLNLGPDPGDYYQLSLGLEGRGREVFYLNGLTWKYRAPLGIPYGPSLGSSAEDYPGYVRAFGLGLGYQRLLWQGLFASLNATPFLQFFHEEGGAAPSPGFQLFFQGQLGYQIDLPGGRLHLKPALAFNWWPVNTGLPASFQAREDRWPDHFLFEPYLDIALSF